MSAELQVKLLRVLETGRFMRVGSTQSLEADVRVIAATNRDPLEAVAAGKLREDLMYRLNVFPIDMPPLRDRLEDVPLLAEHFLAAISAQEGQVKRFSPRAMDRLCGHRWPGNVRELRNAVQRAYVMAGAELIDDDWLPNATGAPSARDGSGATRSPEAVDGTHARQTVTIPIGSSLAEMERTVILATLDFYENHRERAAAVLGISLKTLYNRLKEYAADAPRAE